MANKPLLQVAAIFVLAVISITSAAFLAGLGFLSAVLIGGLSGALAGTVFQLYASHKRTQTMKTAMEELQSQFIYLHERQGQAEAKLQTLAQQSLDAPSLAMHATATDIDVLGSLVRDLAKTVAEHDGKLAEQAKAKEAAPARAETFLRTPQHTQATLPHESLQRAKPDAFSLALRKPAVPQAFEDDAEIGFTTDHPPVALSPAAAAPVAVPSPAVLAELKTTLSSAIKGNHLELCLQPIVVLPQRKARGYEATLALKGEKTEGQDGTNLRRIALATGLQKELDRTLLGRASHIARVLRARNREVVMCLGVSVESLFDPDFRTMLEDIARNDSKLARSIMLEIDDADFRAAGPLGRERIAAIGKLGVSLGLALQDSLRFHAPELVTVGISQLRVPAVLMQSASQGAGAIADIHPADVSELLQRHGIDLLVSAVGDEDTVREMLDFAASFAQGDLFGKARTVRPEVLEPKQVGSAATRMANAPVNDMTPTGQAAQGRNIPRQSFRSLLRRA